MSDDLEMVIRRYYQTAFGMGATNIRAIDQHVGPDFVAHSLRQTREGCEGYIHYVSMLAAGFSDMHHSVCDIFSCDNRVAARWQWTGRHNAEFMGLPPTHRLIVLKGIDIFRVDDDKIAELWQEIDILGILQQIRAPHVKPHDERIR